VLDKHTSATFSLRDMELLAVFARQAAAAIRAARVQRDSQQLLRAALAGVGGADVSEEQLDALISAATNELDTDPDAPFWRLVDRVARMRDLSDRELRIVSDILDVLATHAGRGRRSV
jgi:GAF domain-containing protein